MSQDIYLANEETTYYVGTGYLPFLVGTGEVLYVHDGRLQEFNIATRRSTVVYDDAGIPVTIDANPYCTRRLLYDDSSSILMYCVESQGILVDDSWRDFKVLSLRDQRQQVIKIECWIYDFFADSGSLNSTSCG